VSELNIILLHYVDLVRVLYVLKSYCVLDEMVYTQICILYRLLFLLAKVSFCFNIICLNKGFILIICGLLTNK
jgi:hypothetical protein